MEKKIDGVKAIYEYTHCGQIKECEECECHKEIDEIKGFDNLCEFIRTYSTVVRSKIEETLSSVL